LTPACVNDGGPKSIVLLDVVPTLEAEVLLSSPAIEALRCWEARPGEIMTALDPMQNAYRVRIVSLDEECAVVVPFEELAAPPESRVAIEVYQALPEKERFELILQKLTEVGVTRIVPYTSARSTTLEERDAGQKKSHRWPDVLLRAARQCRRAAIPELAPVVSWDEALYRASHADLKLILYEGRAQWTVREALQGYEPFRVAIVVGPEGGFEPAEIDEAQRLGFLPVTLGPRILRTETASIVAASLVQYEIGDMG